MTTRIHGSKVILVPFCEEYLTDTYVSWLNDPETVRYSELRHRQTTREDCRIYFDAMKSARNYFWAVLRASDGEHVGNITAYMDHNNRICDLAIVMGGAPGKGLGKEAWCLACHHLLTVGGLRKVTAGTMAVNQPMLKLFAAAGMVEEGRRVRQFLLDGTEVDLVLAAAFAASTKESH